MSLNVTQEEYDDIMVYILNLRKVMKDIEHHTKNKWVKHESRQALSADVLPKRLHFIVKEGL